MTKLLMLLSVLSLAFTGCTVSNPSNGSGDNKIDTPIISNKVSGEAITFKDEFNILKFMPDDKNYMVSPFSLKMAMSLAANGADGTTKDEILTAFGIDNLDSYNTAAKELIERYEGTSSVKLNVANSIWLNKDVAGKDIKFTDEYKKLVSEYYRGTASEEDAKNIAMKINSWVEKKTNNKIKNLLPEGDAKFLSVLVNTIYFKGEWAEQFEEYATKEEDFTDRNGKVEKTDFMHKTERYRFYEDENMKMVRVPYKGGKTAMYLVLPTNEDKMDIATALDNMNSYKVRLSFPKFKTEYSLSFKEILKHIGIEKAFEKWEAEFDEVMFKGVKEGENVYVDDVLQKTFIEVDENGTEAAAATAVIMNKATSIGPGMEEIKEFKADRPFIYFIRDDVTHEVLFIGEYAFTK